MKQKMIDDIRTLKERELIRRFAIFTADENYRLSPCKVHQEFRKVYGKNLKSHIQIFETQFPPIYSRIYKYKINKVNLEFYAKNHKLKDSATITMHGLEEDIKNLERELRGGFHIELI